MYFYGFCERQQQTGLGLGRRRERTERKTAPRACHVKEIWEASADPQRILAEGSQPIHRHRRASRHGCLSKRLTRRTASCPWVISQGTSLRLQLLQCRGGAGADLLSADCGGGKRFCCSDAGSGTSLPWAYTCRSQNLDGGQAGLVGARREGALAKCKNKFRAVTNPT